MKKLSLLEITWLVLYTYNNEHFYNLMGDEKKTVTKMILYNSFGG